MKSREKTIFHIIIFSIAFLLFANILPFGNIKNHDVSKAQGEIAYYEEQTCRDKIITHVVFTQKHLYSITQRIEIEQFNEVDRVTFRLLDQNFKPVCIKYVRVELIDRDSKVTLKLDVDVVPGENYFYEWIIPEVDEEDGELPIKLKIPMGYKNSLKQAENQATYINEQGTIEYALIADYDYSKEYPLWAKIIFTIIVFGGAFIICKAGDTIAEKSGIVEAMKRHEGIIKKIVTAVIISVSLVLIVLSSFINIWNGNIDDRIVYAVGILTLMGWIISGVWCRKDQTNTDNPVQIWKNYIQIVCFMMAFYSACRFVNAEAEITHIVNTRRIIIYLIIAFAMIIDKHNRPDFRIWKNNKMPLLVIWAVFLGIMIYNQAELTWPPVILLTGIPFLFKMNKEGMRRLLNNFSLGVYGSFIITTVYSLAHRPYNTWILYRYAGMFHTVAYTGMYLSVVMAVSFARVLIKKRYSDYLFFSVSVGYTFLSMTRAAIMSIGVACVFTFMLVLLNNKNQIKDYFGVAFKLAIMCFLSFFMVFSATRMIPAIINDPIYMILEDGESYGVCKGERIDSPRYMRFNRYVEIMFGRFGFSTVGESASIEPEILLVSIDNSYVPLTAVKVVNEANLSGNLSNGRKEIFEAYIKNIGLEPHDEFGLIYNDDEFGHAHNAFLQISYLFGIVDGIIFLVILVLMIIIAIINYLNEKGDINSLVPLMVVLAFCVCGLVEWTYQPGIPIGLAFMLVQVFLTKRAVEEE